MENKLEQPWTANMIYNVLSRDPYTSKLFEGVFPIDRLPRRVLRRPCLIVGNFDEHDQSGSHWYALVLSNDKDLTVYYFESYGVCPLTPELRSFLQRVGGGRVCLSRRRLQSESSAVCGVYATLFLLYYAKYKNVNKFFNMFPMNGKTRDNDKIVQYLFLERCYVLNLSSCNRVSEKNDNYVEMGRTLYSVSGGVIRMWRRQTCRPRGGVARRGRVC